MKKFMISSAVFAFAFAIASTAGAVYQSDIYTMSSGYLKVGSGYGAKISQNANVKAAQTALNACVPGSNLTIDGKFGPLTKGVFVSFQNSKNIKPDGIIGPVTAQQLADCSGGTTVSTVAGCTPGALFSTTTGASCSGSTVFGSSSSEGYLSNDAKLGSYNATKVMEGDKDKVVFGFEVLAKDADQKIDGLSVAFKNAGTGSAKLSRVASEISVWLDGKEIGRKSVSNWSSDTSDVYTYRFTGMTGVIKKDMKGQVLVAISATNTMDTADISADNWKVDVGTSETGSTMYVSAVSPNGRYRDYGNAALVYSTIDFQKAGSGDQKFKVTTASSNPVAQTVAVSNTSDTTDRVLLAFDAKAENTGMIVQKVPVTIAAIDGALDGTVPYTAAIVKTVSLYANGTKIATESTPQDGTDSASEVIIFGNNTKLNYAIASNATVKFEVRADINDIDDSLSNASDFDNGDKVSASVDSSTMTVEIDNINKDTVTNKTGASTGEAQTFRADGLMVTMGAASSSATSNNAGEILNRTISIPVTIKALDSTVYVDNTILNGTTIAGTDALSFTFEDAAGATFALANSATFTSSNAPVEGNGYRIDSGTERSFMITIIANGTTGDTQAQYRVQLNKGKSYTNAALTTGASSQDLSPANAYETSYFAINQN